MDEEVTWNPTCLERERESKFYFCEYLLVADTNTLMLFNFLKNITS